MLTRARIRRHDFDFGISAPARTAFIFIPALATLLVACAAQTLRAAEPIPDTVAAGAALVEAYADPRFFEGPTWDPGTGKLYFTAFGENNHTQILRLDGPGKVHVFKDNTEGVNGTYLSNDGRLLGAQAFGHRGVSYDFATGDMRVLASDAAWHQPNDICQTSNGDIFFTDPDFADGKTSAVYRLSGGKATKVVSDMAKPNGCIAANDGRTLYVGDSHYKHWKAYPIAADGTIGAGRIFFDPDTENRDSPDGMSIDDRGNLYFAGRGGVWAVTPEGKSMGLIPVPEFCSNVTFGGADGKTLYLTCSKKLYQLAMQVRGGQFTGKPAK
jgi:gluconolactonase